MLQYEPVPSKKKGLQHRCIMLCFELVIILKNFKNSVVVEIAKPINYPD